MNFCVVVPGNPTVNFNVPGVGHEVFQLSLAATATLHVNPGRELEVLDAAEIAGLLSTDNGMFVGNAAPSTLPGTAAGFGTGGGVLGVGGTQYNNTSNIGDLVVTQGPGSQADLSGVLTANFDSDLGGLPSIGSSRRMGVW